MRSIMKAVVRRRGRVELCRLLGVRSIGPGPLRHLPLKVREAIAKLTLRAQEIIHLRFGVGDGFPCSLVRTAQELHLRQKQVVPLERQAIVALRRILR